jgi:hypothetical protein
MSTQTTIADETIDADTVPPHLQPRSLHTLVLLLWAVVGVFTGFGLAAALGAYRLVEDQDIGVFEQVSSVGSRSAGLFVVAAVALGALAVVEVILITLGHVEHAAESGPTD